MVVKGSDAKLKNVRAMIINEYKINPQFSGALVEISGEHGALTCINEDRIYFIIKGSGEFTLDGQVTLVGENDLIFVPSNTPYNLSGKMKYFLICSPEFNPADDKYLGK